MENKSFNAEEVYKINGAIDYQDGGIVSKQVIKNSAGNITLFAFDKGQGLSEHTAPFDAVVQVIDGESEVIIGGKKHAVREGEMIIMPANVPHALNALVPFKMCLVMLKG